MTTIETELAQLRSEFDNLPDGFARYSYLVELAALLYQKKDMEGTAYCAGRALAITERPRTYITEGSAWGSQPADLRSLGLYYTGRKEEALTYAKQASALEPENRRLRDNAELIARELQVTSRSMEPVQLSPSTQM